MKRKKKPAQQRHVLVVFAMIICMSGYSWPGASRVLNMNIEQPEHAERLNEVNNILDPQKMCVFLILPYYNTPQNQIKMHKKCVFFSFYYNSSSYLK
jgi:hypothetical protein